MVDEISESQEELLRKQPFLGNPLIVPTEDQRSTSSSESLPPYVITDYPDGIFMRSVSSSSDSFASADSMEIGEDSVGLENSRKEILPADGDVLPVASREKNVLSTLEEEEEKRDEIQPVNDGPEGECILRKLPVSLKVQSCLDKDAGRVRLPVNRNTEVSCVASISHSLSEDVISPEDAHKLVHLLGKVLHRRKRSGDMGILEAAAMAGMRFDPPRWWRPGGYGDW